MAHFHGYTEKLNILKKVSQKNNFNLKKWRKVTSNDNQIWGKQRSHILTTDTKSFCQSMLKIFGTGLVQPLQFNEL